MAVFDEFRRAWREAVDNFWRELDGAGDGGGGGATDGAAYREVGRVRTQLEELGSAIDATRQRLAEEIEQVEACARRERLARSIGDEETARIAARYRGRHQERAQVLRQKLDVLEAERRLCRRDLHEMEKALLDGRVKGAARVELEDFDRHPREDEFRTLEDAQRARSAEERLEDLKRRMGN